MHVDKLDIQVQEKNPKNTNAGLSYICKESYFPKQD